MRTEASILHVDLDAFFASVEQLDKPSLRNKPVVVGGIAGRGVVAAASYPARAFGVRSAMSIREAKSICPHAAYLVPRFYRYQQLSERVQQIFSEVCGLVEPMSLDEAFLDLRHRTQNTPAVPAEFALFLQHKILVETGLTVSIGVASSKLLAKIASELNKPNGIYYVAIGEEQKVLDPLPITVIPGLGPATAQKLSRLGPKTIADLRSLDFTELQQAIGKNQAGLVHELAQGIDNRNLVKTRPHKSMGTETTFQTDQHDQSKLQLVLTEQAKSISSRLQRAKVTANTISLKIKDADFQVFNRSYTLNSPTSEAAIIAETAHKLLKNLNIKTHIRLIGINTSNLTRWTRESLFELPSDSISKIATQTVKPETQGYYPGLDVTHLKHGRGWVWGVGNKIVTVRFETASSNIGKIFSFAVTDPELANYQIWEAKKPAKV